MKIFLDTADVTEIKTRWTTGLIDGITTNPSLIRKSGRNHEDVYQELKEIGINDISMEVIGSEVNMISEGKRLHKKFGKCATIKVPCTREGLRACAKLSVDNIRVNVTLVFSVAQSILASKAGATYISPFVGRLDDISFDGVGLVKDIAALYREQMVTTQVLAASLRDVSHASQCFRYGADVVTMPTKVFDGMYDHILTDKGMDIFDKDYAKSIENLEVTAV